MTRAVQTDRGRLLFVGFPQHKVGAERLREVLKQLHDAGVVGDDLPPHRVAGQAPREPVVDKWTVRQVDAVTFKISWIFSFYHFG